MNNLPPNSKRIMWPFYNIFIKKRIKTTTIILKIVYTHRLSISSIICHKHSVRLYNSWIKNYSPEALTELFWAQLSQSHYIGLPGSA